MAVYDNNGTANAEIGKLYDNDGTANTQTGKVYDNDGTANSLIYQANLILVPNAAEYPASGWIRSNSSVSYSGSTLNISGSGYISFGGRAVSVYPVDVTSFTKMTIKGTTTGISDHYLCSAFTSTGLFSSTACDYKGSTLVRGVYHQHTVGGTSTITINNSYDITSLSGTYYVGMIHACNSGESPVTRANASFTSIVFE